MSASYQQLAQPPNIMSLYMQMDARNRASDQINRGFALIAANHSSPAMAQTIMQSVGGGPDAGQQANNLMSIYQGQQQMAAQQQLMQQAPEIAAKLGLPEAAVRAEIMAGRGPDLIKNMEPTNEQRNIQWKHDQFIKGGGDEATWQRDYAPLIYTGGLAGASDPMWQVYRTERQHATETDPNTPFPNYADWTAQRQADAVAKKDEATNRVEAGKQFPLLDANLNKYLDNLGDIATDPNLPNIVNHPYLDLSKLNEAGRGFNQKVEGARTLAKSLTSKGGALTASALASIADAEGLSKYDLTEEQYRSIVLEPQIKQALSAAASNYIAAGKGAQMPGYLRPYADQTGLPPRVGAPQANSKLKPMTEDDLAAVRADIERIGPRAALKHAEEQGLDTSPLR
jgi:hypothetical protein